MDQQSAGLVSGWLMREDVPKLAIRKLVHAPGEADGEVAGDTGQGSEVERVNRT